MNKGFDDLNLGVARARIVLSVLAIVSLYVDPTIAGGAFRLTGHALVTVVCHFTYSVGFYFALKRRPADHTLAGVSAVLDLFFATAVAFATEGPTSPSYIFFIFAIVAVGIRPTRWLTVAMTAGSVLAYLGTIMISDGLSSAYAMRAVYLAIAGYLISFFGQQRAAYEARTRELELRAERHAIARSLHDGYIQALAGVNLRLQTCCELITRKKAENALTELTELQNGVAREYDAARAWVRELAGVETAAHVSPARTGDPLFTLAASFTAPTSIGEHILQIALEGIRNASKHAGANMINVAIRGDVGRLTMVVDDDGAGFSQSEFPPWAIASRVDELGGSLRLVHTTSARIEIEVPTK
jgi:signal transduction histidine kinase